MGKTKSIGEKIAGTMKDIVSIAANAADHAMKTDEAPPTVEERSAAYIPLAADGLVSDPMMVPPIAAAHAPRRKRAPLERAAKASRRTPAKKAVKKSAAKPAKKTAAGRSRSAAKTTARKPAGKHQKSPERKSPKELERHVEARFRTLRCRRDGWTRASRGRTLAEPVCSRRPRNRVKTAQSKVVSAVKAFTKS